jgi:hypothetical protein
MRQLSRNPVAAGRHAKCVRCVTARRDQCAAVDRRRGRKTEPIMNRLFRPTTNRPAWKRFALAPNCSSFAPANCRASYWTGNFWSLNSVFSSPRSAKSFWTRRRRNGKRKLCYAPYQRSRSCLYRHRTVRVASCHASRCWSGSSPVSGRTWLSCVGALLPIGNKFDATFAASIIR